jgi:hypothetical protein
MILLGIGLLLLWLVGLSEESAGWLLWLDFVAGILSIIGGLALTRPRTAELVGEPVALAMALFVLWIIALATGTEAWKAWWTFAFACAYVLLGLAGGAASESRGRTGVTGPMGPIT